MMEQYWFVVAFICSLFNGAFIYTNQIFKLAGPVLMFFRGLGQFFSLIVLFMFFKPIDNALFYILCCLQGFIISFNDYRLFRSAKAFGAEVTGALQPLSIGLIFVLWLIINPADLGRMAARPLHFFLEILCLGGIVFSIFKMKAAKYSARAMRYLLPCLCLLAINDVINKKAMAEGAENLASAIYFYCLITAFISGTVNLFVYAKKYKISALFEKRYLLPAAVIILCVTLCMITKNYAMFLTPNPAYVSAIIFLYPLWIIWGNMVYRRLFGQLATASVRVSTVLVLLTSVIGLILLR